jgi:hypothetical protein
MCAGTKCSGTPKKIRDPVATINPEVEWSRKSAIVSIVYGCKLDGNI